MKALAILGTRPNFIKHYAFHRAAQRAGIDIVTAHTGQHYDIDMSDAFFRELALPAPNYVNDVRKASPAREIGEIMDFVERVLYQERPNVTLVYGDVTSTLAGAIASARLGIPVAHVEAGIRAHDRFNAEEINRRVAECAAHTLFAHIEDARQNLLAAGYAEESILLTGDIVKDSLDLIRAERGIQISDRGYIAATIHRAENTDSAERLGAICDALAASRRPVKFALHPRTRAALDRFGLTDALLRSGRVELLPPLGYADSIRLIAGAERVLSDSGGVRREAYILGKPVVSATEMVWVPAMVNAGWEWVAGANAEKLRQGLGDFTPPAERPEIFGDGHAADRIAQLLAERYGTARSYSAAGICNADSRIAGLLDRLGAVIPPVPRADGLRTRVCVVIPCYNEEDSLPTLFHRLDGLRVLIDSSRYMLSFVLVDDGSKDTTWAMLSERFATDPTVTLVRNPTNLGFGGALKAGLRAAKGEIIVTCDADTNFDVRETPALLDLMTDDVDVVTASTLHEDGNWNYPIFRFVFTRGAAFCYRLALGKANGNVRTFTAGFRAYRAKRLDDIFPDANDFLATAELLVRALLAGLRVVEMPTTNYDRLFGRSKLKVIPTTLSHLGLIGRILLRRFHIRSPRTRNLPTPKAGE